MTQKMVQVYDRKKGRVQQEEQYQAGLLHFLYETVLGRILLKLVISTRLFSKLYAVSVLSAGSTKKIQPFIDRYQLQMSDFEEKTYTSFNDFFIRKLKPDRRPFSLKERDLCSPADARVQVFPISEDLMLNIKNSRYSVASLLGQEEQLSPEYQKGTCVVLRLTVTDYHRYVYFDEGRLKASWPVLGCLHTVSPISLERRPVYVENSRVCSVLETKHFGEVIQIEVGALLVGRITNHPLETFQRGDEKGYFSYGGSTIILLFKEGHLQVDQDIWAWSQQEVESMVRLGEKIGVGKEC